MNSKIDRLTLFETLGSIFWFFMDAAWMLEQNVLAFALIAPTTSLNLAVFRYTAKDFSSILATAAVNSWMMMNIFWMISDLAGAPKILVLSRIFFALGLTCLLLSLWKNDWSKESLQKLLARFRRMRISK